MTGPGADDPTLADHLADMVEELEDVEAQGGELRVRGRAFAVVSADGVELQLDPAVAAAAQRTPDVTPSPRGPGWIRFRPATLEPHAVDRAEAWLRSAHRRATSGR